MATKHRTKSDNEWMGLITDLGCIACLVQGTPGTPGEVHHIRAGVGRGQRSEHKESICLCPAHHRGTDHPRTPSIHMARRAFIWKFGTEQELMERTLQELGLAVS
ncbi:RecA-dependent nuclease family protein [Serratia phage Parlo]|uniref:RecA-dependent nuclease family protein n=1 Tax=Serratia phage Parlo TaxID=2557554 RepID=A0A482MG22_9CAUD|nr:RecA-dependent nuclease family protein [Serratia phage Parlo]QBQ72168.1 RecA-dependent nuclease family protein [Serratia phage Parlo]